MPVLSSLGLAWTAGGSVPCATTPMPVLSSLGLAWTAGGSVPCATTPHCLGSSTGIGPLPGLKRSPIGYRDHSR